MTVYEIIYAIREKLSDYTDDTRYSDDYLLFLVNLKRSFFLRREYNQIRRSIDDDLLFDICLELEHVDASICPECVPSEDCDVVRSILPLPKLLELNNRSAIIKVGSIEMFNKPFSLISKERVPYVGTSQFEKNIIYAFPNTDNKIYLKSNNQFYNTLEYINVTILPENPLDLVKYKCDPSNQCYNPEVEIYPVKTWMADIIINTIVEELARLKAIPEDRINNAKQDV